MKIMHVNLSMLDTLQGILVGEVPIVTKDWHYEIFSYLVTPNFLLSFWSFEIHTSFRILKLMLFMLSGLWSVLVLVLYRTRNYMLAEGLS